MPKIPDHQCHECGTLYDKRDEVGVCCSGAKQAKRYLDAKQKARRLRCTCSLWSKTGAGFGFGIWRVVYSGDFVVWTVAIGPLSVYLRYA